MSDEPVESFEVERKYEVSEGSALPAPAALAEAGFAADAAEVHELHAAYYDTPARALAQRRLAVRERRGGKDAGWHLKHKGADGAHELMWPPADRMPDALLEEIEARIGSAEGLAPIAELRTTRHVLRLRDAALREVIELVDDHVRAIDHATGVRRLWREWEAELAPGADTALLDTLEPVLVAAGAAPSPSSAKIARATGSLEALARAAGAGQAQLEVLRQLDAAARAAAERDASEIWARDFPAERA